MLSVLWLRLPIFSSKCMQTLLSATYSQVQQSSSHIAIPSFIHLLVLPITSNFFNIYPLPCLCLRLGECLHSYPSSVSHIFSTLSCKQLGIPQCVRARLTCVILKNFYRRTIGSDNQMCGNSEEPRCLEKIPDVWPCFGCAKLYSWWKSTSKNQIKKFWLTAVNSHQRT